MTRTVSRRQVPLQQPSHKRRTIKYHEENRTLADSNKSVGASLREIKCKAPPRDDVVDRMSERSLCDCVTRRRDIKLIRTNG